MSHTPLAITVLAAALALAGCGHPMQRGEHHTGKGYGAMSPETAPPAQAKVTASMPTLSSGYKKVEAPAGARLYFVNLRNGMTVGSPVKVVFGLSGMGVAPAGIEKVGTGHHHLLVNVSEWDANAPLPANEQFRHSAPARPKPRSNSSPVSTPCNWCWATRTTSRTTRWS